MRKIGLFMVVVCIIGLTVAKVSTAAETQADIIEKAKKEGSLIHYATPNTQDQEAMFKGFSQKYPFIKNEGVKVNNDTWVERVAAERAAKRYLPDVGWGNIFPLAGHVKEGFLIPYNSPERSGIPSAYKDKDGLWTAYSVAYTIVSYNTNLVKPGEAPKNWDDLTNPKWKGKLLSDDNNIDILGAMIVAWGQDKAVAFWKKIAANDCGLEQGASKGLTRVMAGEYAIGIGQMAHNVILQKRAGAPVGWINTLSPMPVLIQAIGIYKNAPHPNAAKLFVDWMIGQEGQQVLNEIGRNPARTGVPTSAVLGPGVKIVVTDPAMVAREKELTQLFQDAMGIKRIGR